MSGKFRAPESEEEESEISAAGTLAPRLIYEVVRRDGEEELDRPLNALIWSGVAAGLLISFSVLGEAVLRAALPDTPWRPIVENFGYAIGFLLVILGRMQLFTENTITTVLPVLAKCHRTNLRKMARLWGVVLTANVVGAFVVAGFWSIDMALPEGVYDAAMDISAHAVGLGVLESFMRGIPAGVLIAALVWILAQVQSGQAGIIVIITWLIAMGDFTHVIAGSVELALMIYAGEVGLFGGFRTFWVPVLAGNILGGTLVFTALAWAQVRVEIVEHGG